MKLPKLPKIKIPKIAINIEDVRLTGAVAAILGMFVWFATLPPIEGGVDLSDYTTDFDDLFEEDEDPDAPKPKKLHRSDAIEAIVNSGMNSWDKSSAVKLVGGFDDYGVNPDVWLSVIKIAKSKMNSWDKVDAIKRLCRSYR